jgi:hypothetical protein
VLRPNASSNAASRRRLIRSKRRGRRIGSTRSSRQGGLGSNKRASPVYAWHGAMPTRMASSGRR